MNYEQVTDELVLLLEAVLLDVPKAQKGNKTAAQRIRTKTIEIAKVSKEWRRVSLIHEKKKNQKKSVVKKSK